MPEKLSPRLMAIVDALPLRRGMRVLEIGCGPGAATREVVRRIGVGHVLGIDRSARAIDQARAASQVEVASGLMSFRCVDAESFRLLDGEKPFDLAFAVRVGALDGRYPVAGKLVLARLAVSLAPAGRLFVDGGDPIRELDLGR